MTGEDLSGWHLTTCVCGYDELWLCDLVFTQLFIHYPSVRVTYALDCLNNKTGSTKAANLEVVPPLGLVLWAHLANQLLDFGSPQRVFWRHRAGIARGEGFFGRVVVDDLVGAVRSSSRGCFTIEP